jgi:hypothetical protein
MTDGSLCCNVAGPLNAHGWQNRNYHQPTSVTIVIDLGASYRITKIRYHAGERNWHRGSWAADSCTTPLGTMYPYLTNRGGWNEVTGSITASSVQVVCSKTRTSWPTDWMFIGDTAGDYVVSVDIQATFSTKS